MTGATAPAPAVAEVVTDGGLRKRRGAVRDPFRQQYVAKKRRGNRHRRSEARADAGTEVHAVPEPGSLRGDVRDDHDDGAHADRQGDARTQADAQADRAGHRPAGRVPRDRRLREPGSQKTLRDFGRLSSLPSANDPLFVFLGVLSGGKKAVFLVKQGVKAAGDGVCRPSKATCDTVEMESGDTAFFDVETDKGVVQYQLDVESVRRRTAAQALAARTKAAADAAKATSTLRATKESGAGPGESLRSDAYRWDADKTVLVRRKRQASSKPKVPGGLASALRVAVGEVRQRPTAPGIPPRRRTARPARWDGGIRPAPRRLRRRMHVNLVTAGESHGPGLTCLVEGLPAGLELDREAIDRDMARRQLGHGRGGRMKIETDRAHVTAGVRHGRTLGGPIALQVANRDYTNWEERMNPWPVEATVPEVHLPRPGHADLVGTQKYGLSDVRDILERASARETAARVAGGAVCKAFLRALGVEVVSHVVQIGAVHAPPRAGAPDAGGLRGHRRRPGPLPGRRREPRDGEAHQRAAQGQRVDRRRLRGRRVRAGPGTGLARELAGAPGRQARRGDLLDPGREGLLDR